MNKEKLKKFSYAIGYISALVLYGCVIVLIVAAVVGTVSHLL